MSLAGTFSVFDTRQAADLEYATPAVDKISDESEPDINSVTGGVPVAPVFLRAAAGLFSGEPGVAVWRAVHHAKGYYLERSLVQGEIVEDLTDISGWSVIMNYDSHGTPGEQISVSSLEVKEGYYYRVRAYNAQGSSPYSNIVFPEFSGP